MRWWTRLKRWQKWLIGLPLGLFGGFLTLGLYAVFIWTPNKSLEEGLGFLLNEDVYATGEARKRLEEYIANPPKVYTEKQLHDALRHAFDLLGDTHADLVAPNTDLVEENRPESYGIGRQSDGFVVGYSIDAPEAAKKIHLGDKVLGSRDLEVNGKPAVQVTVQRGEKTFQVTLPTRRMSRRLQPQSRMLTGTVGYYLMPGASMPNLPDEELKDEYTAYIRQQAQALAALRRPLCGLVFDLRINTGGVGFVMAKAGSLVLGTGRYVVTRTPDDQPQWVGVSSDGTGYQGVFPDAAGKNEHHIHVDLPPEADVAASRPYLAVLTGGDTASAGEIMLIAAKRLPKTRVFGEASSGDTTMRMSHVLTDDTEMIWSYSFMRDAAGRVYRTAVAPDMLVTTDYSRFASDSDPVISAAQAWLRQKGCR